MSPAPARPSSALYVGDVVHQRLKPRRHRLSYRAYWLLLDLDEIDRLARSLRLFSRNRFNLFSFYDRDYREMGIETGIETGVERGAGTLREEIVEAVGRAGVTDQELRIFVLTMPRVLGYVFNPLSTYFCYRADGGLAAIVYEVHNTFGGRHRYPLAVDPGQETIAQSCTKRFYVSPFMDMGLEYAFRVKPPGESVGVAINASDAAGPVLVASLAGERRPLGDAALFRLFLSIPILTVKVIAGIHWEALRIWLKGVKIRPRKDASAGRELARANKAG